MDAVLTWLTVGIVAILVGCSFYRTLTREGSGSGGGCGCGSGCCSQSNSTPAETGKEPDGDRAP